MKLKGTTERCWWGYRRGGCSVVWRVSSVECCIKTIHGFSQDHLASQASLQSRLLSAKLRLFIVLYTTRYVRIDPLHPKQTTRVSNTGTTSKRDRSRPVLSPPSSSNLRLDLHDSVCNVCTESSQRAAVKCQNTPHNLVNFAVWLVNHLRHKQLTRRCVSSYAATIDI